MNEQEQILLQELNNAIASGDGQAISDAAGAYTNFVNTNSFTEGSFNMFQDITGKAVAAMENSPGVQQRESLGGRTLADAQNARTPVPTFDQINASLQATAPTTSNEVVIPGLGRIVDVPEAGGSVFVRDGEQDVLRKFTGEDTGNQLRQFLPNFNNTLAGLRDSSAQAADELTRLRAGEFDDRFSNPAFKNVRVARTLEEARAIREQGLIPIAARDAELIRQTGERQAAQLIADAEQSLAVQQNEARFARGQQAGVGLGNAIASAITRSNVGAGQNNRVTQLANQARSNVLQGVENRRAARAEAGGIDARSRIDAMLADTDAARQLQDLMVADARDSFTRRFQAERDIQARQQALEDQILRMEQSRPQLLQAQVAIANQLSRPTQAQFIQDRRGSGQAANARNAALTRVGRIARTGSRLGQMGVDSDGIFRNLDEAGADAEIQSLMQDYAELGALMTMIEEEGSLTPELAAAVEALDQQVRPLITRFRDSGIIRNDGSVNVEKNDRGIGFSPDFGKITRRAQGGFDELIESFGLGSEVGEGLIPRGGSGTLQSRASNSQQSDALMEDF